MKTPLSDIRLIADILLFCFINTWNDYFKMNEIITKFLLTGDKFMPEWNLRQKDSKIKNNNNNSNNKIGWFKLYL